MSPAASTEAPPAGRVELQPTFCAICGTAGNALELYPSTLTAHAFTSAVFSARRLPDRIHYRMVRCRSCGLVRSDPVLGQQSLSRLYGASTFDYGQELEALRVTYGRVLDGLAELVPARRGLLDVGTGSGFVLELAGERGWSGVRGVEPSHDAVACARDEIRPLIALDVMRPGLFEPESFDAITLFQVLDHMPDPPALLAECKRLLRPDGVLLTFNHNVNAISVRLLRSRSPIVDVEHTYLYSPATISRLLRSSGFEVQSVRSVRNTYSVRYLAHLLPLPQAIKPRVLSFLQTSRFGEQNVTVPLGNLCAIGRASE